ncbi:MAG TPA: hypothetical protein ENL06_01400 [Candidatus Portnoybacteria bacterium]|nr:hypothetical protein [Candidatus Portnoybacteria bacterium]
MENPNDIIVQERQLLEYKKKDDELIQGINNAIAQTMKVKAEKDKESKIREEYWKHGTELSTLKKIHPKKAKTRVNRIWSNLLTIIPYWVNRTPEPTPVAPSLKNDQRERVIRALQNAWETDNDMKWITQKVVLHWLLYHIGVIKMRWNNELKGIETTVVHPEKIGFDPKATKMENCEYFWEILEDTAENIIKKFPKKKKQIKELVRGELKTKLRYIEFWGGNGKWLAWKLGNIILDKKKNPNFDKKGLFKKPQFPYIILNCYNLGYSLYDDTGIIDQAIPLQDSLNKIERQILDLNEGQKRVWVASGEAISKEDFQKVLNQTGDLGAYFGRKIPQGGLQLPLAGKPDASMFNDIEHLLGEIDNVMGVHAALRGQYTPGMSKIGMRGYAMMINQDLAKDLIVSRIEQLAENWFNMFIHLSLVYNSGDIKFNTPDETLLLTRDDIPLGLKIMVKKGSMLPIDKASRADMAMKLAQMQMEAPADVYNDLGYGDAETRLKHLDEFRQGQVVPTENTQQGQQLQRLQKVLQSPEFQKMSPQEQQAIVQQGRQVVEAIKSNQ